jgi:integrase
MMERFENRHEVGAIRATTYDGYERHLRNHVLPILGDIRIQELTTADLDRLWAKLATTGRIDGKGGLSPRTIRTLNALVSQTLIDAQVRGIVPRNVSIGVSLPSAAPANIQYWNAQQARTFLRGTERDRDFALYHLDLTTGMRRGELLGLKWHKVDMNIGELEVVETVVPINHKPVWSVPKTASGFRIIPLDTKTLEVLRDHRRHQARERLALGAAYVDRDLVFPGPNGDVFNPENLSKRFARRIAQLNLPKISFHGLRHTYATLARRGGMDVKDLSIRLGHADVSTTLRLYVHVPVDVARRSAQSAADYILG